MTFEEINIDPGDSRYIAWGKHLSGLVEQTNEKEMIATALLLGATFITTNSDNSTGDIWFAAKFEGRILSFTDRFSMHRSAVAFLICTGILEVGKDTK